VVVGGVFSGIVDCRMDVMMVWGCHGWLAVEIEGIVVRAEIACEGRKEVRGRHGEVHDRGAS